MYTQEKLINPGNGFDPRIIDVADALVFETTRGSYVYEIAKIREPVVAGKYKFLGGLILRLKMLSGMVLRSNSSI
jgi:hypothetical protein